MFLFIEKKVLGLLPNFKQRPFWSVFLSKFIYGINHFTLIFSGYVGIRKRTFVEAELLSSIIWVLGFVSLGYFFSSVAFTLGHNIRRATIIILLLVLAFVFIQRAIMFMIEVFSGTKEIDLKK